MRVAIASFAKFKEAGLAAAEAQYLSRLQGKAELRVELLELSAARRKGSKKQDLRAAEGALLLDKMKPGSVLVALDEGGKELTSPEFAAMLGKHMGAGTGLLCFAIAGPFGWAPTVKKHAQMLLSLGRMTYPAHVARFLLVEQIYRANCILKGHPYHK